MIGRPRPRTFKLAASKVIVERKKIGGVEAMLEMVRQVVPTLEGELDVLTQHAA